MSTNSVLLVGNFFSSSVSNRAVCEDLAERLAGAGWRVCITSQRQARVARLADMALAAWRRRRDYRVAHVEVFSGPAFIWAEVVSEVVRAVGKPYVLTLRGGNLPELARRWPRRVRRLLGRAAAVTVPSTYLLERMRPYRRDLWLIPNPIEVERYPFRLRSSPAPRLVWLRAFHRIYNPVLAVNVLRLLTETMPEARLLMVGRDKHDGSLERTSAEATRLGLWDRIKLIPGVPKVDAPRCLNRGDVLLNTPDIDNTPVSVLEGMACGLCVTSTDAGGIPYLIEDGRDGLLSPAGDADAMTSNVLRLLKEPALAGELSLNARRKAEGCDWAHVLPKWMELLSSVASGR
jgi:glycosyltransferase involved in cell wall biosynthesis